MEPNPSVTADTIHQMADWGRTADKLLQQAAHHQVWYFKGALGAGKTTLIRALCDCLDIKEAVTSPTFSLVHEYHTQAGEPVYHFDLYRLDDAQEAIAIGLEDYLARGKYLFIEWPEILSSLAMPDHFEIMIEPLSSSKRTLRWSDITQASGDDNTRTQTTV